LARKIQASPTKSDQIKPFNFVLADETTTGGIPVGDGHKGRPVTAPTAKIPKFNIQRPKKTSTKLQKSNPVKPSQTSLKGARRGVWGLMLDWKLLPESLLHFKLRGKLGFWSQT
jgi:hypothetical protein